jgi:hypothetical protein
MGFDIIDRNAKVVGQGMAQVDIKTFELWCARA